MNELTQAFDQLIQQYDGRNGSKPNGTIIAKTGSSERDRTGDAPLTPNSSLGILRKTSNGGYSLGYHNGQNSTLISLVLSPEGALQQGSIQQIPSFEEISKRVSQLEQQNNGRPLTQEQIRQIAPKPSPPKPLEAVEIEPAFKQAIAPFLNNAQVMDDTELMTRGKRMPKPPTSPEAAEGSESGQAPGRIRPRTPDDAALGDEETETALPNPDSPSSITDPRQPERAEPESAQQTVVPGVSESR